MSIQTPKAADAIGRAMLAAALTVADEPETQRWSSRERSRIARLAAAAGLARGLAWPVSRAARLIGVAAEDVWNARSDGDPVFLAAEREARAGVAQALGPLAPPGEEAEDEVLPPTETAVVRLRPLSTAILDWARAYVGRGVPIDELADLFSVSPEALAVAIENKR